MLRKLNIHNYAIIQDLEIAFEEGLIILTGETGSGKSILLGALGLILGDRADTKVVFDPEQKCIVEATFEISAYQLAEFFEENDLDYESITLIRREINPNGKTRAFINDTPVNLNQLKALSEQLIDLHQQFDTLSISSETFQLKVIDALAESGAALHNYQSHYLARQKTQQELNKLIKQQAEMSKESEFLQFQLDELLNAALNAEEQSELEEELRFLSHAEEIKKQSGTCFHLLSESEYAVLSQLENISSTLHPLAHVNPALQNLSERIESVQIELQDISRDLESLFERTEYDPERLFEVESRLDLLYKLQKKHQVEDIASLLEIQSDLEAKLNGFQDITESIQILNKQLQLHQSEVENSAVILRELRQSVFTTIETKVKELLGRVNMQHAELKINSKPLETYNLQGPDFIQFTFAANKGSRFLPIQEVASGGEMSRLALCIKSIVGSALSLPTMIFDEIDTGVSGQVALQMSTLLKGLAHKHQVVVITHTPQVAARGNQHFVVYKEVMPDRTYTKIKSLEPSERTHQIAVMLSTDPPTPAAIENAKELISL